MSHFPNRVQPENPFRALADSPAHPELCAVVANSLISADVRLAYLFCQRGLALDKDDYNLRMISGVCQQCLGLADEAERSYRLALLAHPDIPGVWRNLASLSIPRERKETFLEIIDSPGIPDSSQELLLNKSMFLKSIGRIDQAASYARAAFGRNAHDPAALFCLAEIELQRGNGGDALKHVFNLLALAPADVQALLLALRMPGLDPALAEGVCRRVTSLNPEETMAWNYSGYLAKTRDRMREAAACFVRALLISPGAPEVLSNLGTSLAGIPGHLEQSAKFQLRALYLNPEMAGATLNLGLALQGLGRTDEAVARYGQALKLDYALTAEAFAVHPLKTVSRPCSQPRKKSRVYDCFPFFNELDLLELRLNELYEVVDKFVLVECVKTFTRLDKPLYYADNRERFRDFQDKIIHVVIGEDELEGIGKGPWALENYQRDCLVRGLADSEDDDLVIIGDVDEIPRISVFQGMGPRIGHIRLQMRLYFYFLDCLCSQAWNEPVIIPRRGLGAITPTRARTGFAENILFDAGWHFTFLGGYEQIRYKLEAYAHTEFNTREITSREHIEKMLREGKSLFGDLCAYHNFSGEFRFTRPDDSYPAYIRKNPQKYRELGWFSGGGEGAWGDDSARILPAKGYLINEES